MKPFPSSPFSRIGCGLALVFALLGAPGWGADYAFKLSLASKVEMEIQGKVEPMVTLTELEYIWRHQGADRLLLVDSVFVEITSKEMSIPPTLLSRSKFITNEEGKRKETRYEDAPPEMKTKMEASYGVPLFTRRIGAQGAETSRQVLAGPGAEDLISNGIVANGLMFHPLPAPGKAEWTSQTEMSMGNGAYVKGPLKYRRLEHRPGHVYAVQGTLTNPSVDQAGGVTVKDVHYDVKGEASYEPEQEEWESGKLTIQATFRITAEGKDFAKAKGTIEATLVRRAK